MTDAELRRYSDACINLKYLSIVYLLVGLVVMSFAADRHWALGALALVVLIGGFGALQARAEEHWDRFIDGAAGELGKTHPLIKRGREL